MIQIYINIIRTFPSQASWLTKKLAQAQVSDGGVGLAASSLTLPGHSVIFTFEMNQYDDTQSIPHFKECIIDTKNVKLY